MAGLMMDSSAVSSLAEPTHASASLARQSHASTNISQTHGEANRPHELTARLSKSKSMSVRPICRYFASKKGCRAGEQCRFQHVRPTENSSSAQLGNEPAFTRDVTQLNPADNIAPTSSSSASQGQNITGNITPINKPIPQAEKDDPREFHIKQVVRRYKPFRADLDQVTELKFRLDPTDPDFPFELDTGLHCVLSVPVGYPKDGTPTLAVQNPEMVRGFQINVEKGFDELVAKSPGKSLLALLNDLDRNLERFLTSSKATTFKLVANKGSQPKPPELVATPKVEAPFIVPVFARYTEVELREARARREVELRQLEARLGRSDLFSKVGDGIAFNVPIQTSFVANIPDSLRAVRDAALIVPEVYPLEPCTIVLKGVDGRDAENVEVGFEKRVTEKPELSLMAHINYLAQNLSKLAVDHRPDFADTEVTIENQGDSASHVEQSTTAKDEVHDPSRPHLRFIPRPPEWSQPQVNSSSDETEDSATDDEDVSDDETETAEAGAVLPVLLAGSEKGIQISFPGLELNLIELLHIARLSISVKCDRCKDSMDVKDIVPSTTDTTSSVRSETCQKCSAILNIKFNGELMHATSIKAGYIDLENCSVVDLLPSTFQPTCSSCSTTFTSPSGVIAVRGDTKLTVCRSCHAKMTFSIPEAKFLRVSIGTSLQTLPTRSRKPKENLGLAAGTPLPNNGRCTHYSKSYRWFRFSCCSSVFPCDKCHDSPATNPAQKLNPHPNEHADRMICGWCSREQRYHPDTCRMCGRSVVKKVNTTGFWEGGKGTREKALMSRKEGRKYKSSGREKKELAETKKRKEERGKGGMWWPG